MTKQRDTQVQPLELEEVLDGWREAEEALERPSRALMDLLSAIPAERAAPIVAEPIALPREVQASPRSSAFLFWAPIVTLLLLGIGWWFQSGFGFNRIPQVQRKIGAFSDAAAPPPHRKLMRQKAPLRIKRAQVHKVLDGLRRKDGLFDLWIKRAMKGRPKAFYLQKVAQIPALLGTLHSASEVRRAVQLHLCLLMAEALYQEKAFQLAWSFARHAKHLAVPGSPLMEQALLLRKLLLDERKKQEILKYGRLLSDDEQQWKRTINEAKVLIGIDNREARKYLRRVIREAPADHVLARMAQRLLKKIE